MMSVTRNEAIRRLEAAGHRNAAAELNQWRNMWGETAGWGGWLRRQHPDAISTVWTG